MSDRWRKPLIPQVVEADNETEVLVDGQWRADVVLGYSAEDIERLRTGHACLNCKEPFETAFPDKCPVCAYGVKQFQVDDFAKTYGGERWFGPTESLQDELDRLDDQAKQRIWTPGSSIAT